ncbi:protein NLRC3-like [Garra rufa]|uniref:protein NLRC3-like n=1 Tax=Garra rufa TaxID=137080 RepID=UPI003CCEF933
MEKADIFDTVDKIVACFGPEEAVKVMVDILRKMNQNDLAEQLENERKRAQAEGNKKTFIPVGGWRLYKECKLAFIFDGLDESRLPLNFKSETLNTVEERSSVDVLFTSLVKGNLLPSALVWVTSRPAAANQIPPRYVGLFTEVRGFTDQQNLPVFCWITATVLQDILIENNAENISTTLTEMYIHFLLIQMSMKNQKYDEQEERECTEHLQLNREMILKLAKLAFDQLKKEHIVFYKKDLKECGIDASKDTEFTGMITEIFKREHRLHGAKVFCFVHLSVQEFLAAVHVFLSSEQEHAGASVFL